MDARQLADLLREVGTGFTDAINRGAIAGTVGGPVDLASLLLNQAGFKYKKPIGGSEWIGDQMERMGVVSPRRNHLAEDLANVSAVPIGGRFLMRKP